MQQFEPIFAGDGYRPNVGIVICNKQGQVFWARRVNHDGWQFPQGGVNRNELIVDAMYRELKEETGLIKEQVNVVAHTANWLHYDLPKRFLRNQRRRKVPFKGQKQVWFLLELTEDDSVVDLAQMQTPEFDRWRWVDIEFAIQNIVDFKRPVYQKVLSELGQYLPGK